MKQFSIKTSIFLLVAGIIIPLTAYLLPSPYTVKEGMLGAGKLKHEALKDTPSSRLVIIGGSNCVFGIVSPNIKDSTGLNPINMGLHAGIGLKMMLSECEDEIQEGDLILIIPEYHQFYGKMLNGSEILPIYLFDIIPQKSKYLDIYQLYTIAKHFPEYIKPKLEVHRYLQSNNPDMFERYYAKSYFNQWGDVRIGKDEKRIESISHVPLIHAYNHQAIDAIKAFIDKARDKGANVYVSYPGYASSFYNLNREKIEYVKNQLEANHIPILNNVLPERYRLNDILFYDTEYHLTYQGSGYRTNLLIEDIKRSGIIASK